MIEIIGQALGISCLVRTMKEISVAGTFNRRKFIALSAAGGATLGTGAMIADMALGQFLAKKSASHDMNVKTGGPRMSSGAAPISINTVELVVNDLDRVGDFYQFVLGLQQLHHDGETMALGSSETPLLMLRRDRNARRFPSEAGLFHNAFLMPDRASLGRWLQHAADAGVRLTGAADHDVSEAIYLDDPEGNGIEVYADRPVDDWITETDGQIKMGSHRLDLDGIISAANGSWVAAPEDMIIGHVHLQVGDVKQLHQFMTNKLGQDLTLFEGSAAFYSSGGYHHHFAGNVWRSQGAGKRSHNSTGLRQVTLSSDGSVGTPFASTDPWGTRFVIETRDV
ncbi:VOC family protein [Ruegeria sp. EL01]|jgi:catechol 2,3-dioxygenase|uniref:VOC family protein n=1 Tax=Ruegeria sp. EL01 TaxID=2107578 RepID=UPI000EA80EB6|nr:VOC family protein [Ruegeria sp. EL01]